VGGKYLPAQYVVCYSTTPGSCPVPQKSHPTLEGARKIACGVRADRADLRGQDVTIEDVKGNFVERSY